MLKELALVSLPGEVIPAELVELVLKECQSGMGIATVTQAQEGGDEPVFFIERYDDVPTLAKFMATQETLKDLPCLYYFVQFDKGHFSPDSLQPFDIVREGGKALISGCLIGDFSSFSQEKSTHSDAFHAAQAYVIPKITKLWNSHKGNWKEFVKELDEDPVLSRELGNCGIGNSAIVLFSKGEKPDDAEFSIFNASDLAKTFDWGWTSHTLGYGEGEYPKKEPEPEKKEEPSGMSKVASLLFGGGDKKDDPPKEPEKKPDPAIPVIQKQEEPPKTAAETTADDRYEIVKTMERCPAELTGKKRRRWYSDRMGTVPSNVDERPEIPVTKKVLKEFSEVKRELQTEQKRSTVREAVPIFSAETKEKLTEFFLNLDDKYTAKFIDKNSVEMFSPEAISKVEQKWPTFAEQCGFAEDGLWLTDRLEREHFRQIGRIDLEALVTLALNYRAASGMLVRAEAHMPSEEKKEEKKTSVPATGTADRPRLRL